MLQDMWQRIKNDPSLIFAVLIGLCLGTLHASVTNGNAWVAAGLVVVVTIILTVAVGAITDNRPWWDILNPRRQSWAYMFGDPLCLAPALGITAYGWGRGEAPEFARSAWWLITTLIVGLLIAERMNSIDQRRYVAWGAEAALSRPAKRLHNQLVVPVLCTIMLMTSLPLALVWSASAVWIVLLLLAWAALIVADEHRTIDPFWQYNVTREEEWDS